DGGNILKGRTRCGGEMLKSFSNQTELGFTTPKRTHGTFQHSLPAEGSFVFIIIEAAAFCYANQFFTSFPTVLYAGKYMFLPPFHQLQHKFSVYFGRQQCPCGHSHQFSESFTVKA